MNRSRGGAEVGASVDVVLAKEILVDHISRAVTVLREAYLGNAVLQLSASCFTKLLTIGICVIPSGSEPLSFGFFGISLSSRKEFASWRGTKSCSFILSAIESNKIRHTVVVLLAGKVDDFLRASFAEGDRADNSLPGSKASLLAVSDELVEGVSVSQVSVGTFGCEDEAHAVRLLNILRDLVADSD